MNTITKVVTLSILMLSLLPANAEEESKPIAKTKINYTIDLKNHRSLSLCALGLISGYNGIDMIKNSLEVPLYNFCGYNKNGISGDKNLFFLSTFASTSMLLAGTVFVYIGYKLIVKSTQQTNEEYQ